MLETSETEAPISIVNQGYDLLCEIIDKIALACESPDQLASFDSVSEIVLVALQAVPDTTPSPDRERNFAKSPGWARPAAKIAAAGALMSVVRWSSSLSREMADLIRHLAVDDDPAVRNQIFSRLNFLSAPDTVLMWELARKASVEETNISNVVFLLNALRPVMHLDVQALTSIIDNFLKRLANSSAQGVPDAQERLNRIVVPLLLRMWLVHENATAAARIASWIADPITYQAYLRQSASSLREAISQGAIDDGDKFNKRIRSQSIELFTVTTKKAAEVFRSWTQSADREGQNQEQARAALQLLDAIATEVYFGSGAYGLGHKSGDGSESDRRAKLHRFFGEAHDLLESLATASWPSITHHLLETLEQLISCEPAEVFKLISTAVIEGQRGRYNFEQLGLQLLLKIIERYLADYRWIFSDSESARTGLIRALDTFVDVGWPDAQQLAYRLPEMLR